MEKIQPNQYRQAAEAALQGAGYDHKKLVLIHTSIIAAVTLLANILIYVLEQQLASAGGLGGLGTRSILLTAQTMLQFLPALLMPFWAMGYVFSIVNISGGKRTGPGDLAEGFFRFFPVLRLELLMALMYALLAFAATQLGGTVFLWTPWAAPFMNAALAFLADPENLALEQELYVQAYQVMVPMALIMGAVFVGISAPFFYRFRMARLHMMANPGKGAFAAMKESAAMTRFRRFELFKLDLHFWWFYLLEAGAVALGYGQLLFSALGADAILPDVAWHFIFLILSLGWQLVLHHWRKNEVYVTYAKVYQDLCDETFKEETL